MSTSVRLLLAGDTALGGSLHGVRVEELTRRTESVRPLFAEADLRFLSLDCAIGRVGDPVFPEEYLIDCEVDALNLLREWGVNVVSLANNHSTDHGLTAMLTGREHLRKACIEVIGAGENTEEASAFCVTESGGLRLGWIGFASSHPWVGAVTATQNDAGVAALDPQCVLRAVETAKRSVDVVIVSLHWGKEYIPVPPPDNVRLARALIEAGAHVVVGHHPHVIQPIESYQRGVICYSLGNFLFPDYPDQGLRFRGVASESLLVSVDVEPDGAVVAAVTPVHADGDGHLRVLPEARRQQIETELAQVAADLGTTAGEQAWHRAVRRFEISRLRRVIREEVLDAGFRDGTSRLLRLGRKNLKSLGRSLGEIIGGRQR